MGERALALGPSSSEQVEPLHLPPGLQARVPLPLQGPEVTHIYVQSLLMTPCQ